MDRSTFDKLSFNEVMQELSATNDTITTIDELKDFIKESVDNDNYNVAIHLLNAIWNDTADSYYFEYDYCMGTLETPSGITTKEDIEHLIED